MPLPNRPLFTLCLCISSAFSAACSSGGTTATSSSSGSSGTGVATAACTGDAATCLHGTLSTKGFTGAFASAKVQLYTVFPYGTAVPVTEASVANDGTFAFSSADPAARYYMQGIAKFSSAAGAFSVATVAGPFTLPFADAIPLTVKPVFLEAFEGRPSGGVLALSWASAHVYDPATAAEITDAQVSLTAGSATIAMPLGTNLSGQKSYFVEPAAGAAAPTSMTIAIKHAAFPNGASYTLQANAPTFDAAITAPVDQTAIAVGQPLPVAWTADPRAAVRDRPALHQGAGCGRTLHRDLRVGRAEGDDGDG